MALSNPIESLNVPSPNPKLMVIGDSLAQGCRSLTVSASLCAQSWGARVAALAGWPHVIPNHPRPVLFDLEDEIRRLNPLASALDAIAFRGILTRILKNLEDWQHQSPSSARCFDNLAIAGATIADLYARTAQSSNQNIEDFLRDNNPVALHLDKIGDLHVPINARYVLNPSQDPQFQSWSQLDWVEHRLPENLFLQIGHNHGLFQVGFSAEIDNPNNPEASITQERGGGNYFDQWQTLAARLAALPTAVKCILIVLLPKVGAVGNLMPATDDRDAAGYAPAYDPVLSTHPRLPGPQLGAIDRAIINVNDKIKNIVTAAGQAAGADPARVEFIDGYAFIDSIDYKNTREPALRIPVNQDVTTDNRYLNGSLRFGFPRIANYLLNRGGLFSVDGMHPSGVGYAILASKALDVLGVQYDKRQLLQEAFAEDRLLSDYPAELDMVVGILAILRAAINVGHFAHDATGSISDDAHIADVLRAMKTIFIRK